MEKVSEIKRLFNEFNKEKQEIIKKITYIEAQRRILAQIRNGKKVICDNNAENQEYINKINQKISDLGNKSQNFQNEIDVKNVTLKGQVCELISQILARELVELEITIKQKEYEKDIYQQIEKYCDTDQQIAQIEKIIGIEKKEKQIKSRQCRLNEAIKKTKSNQINFVVEKLEEIYPNNIAEEINIADFVPVEEQEIITGEENITPVVQEIIKEISNIVIKFERSELVYKATINTGEEVSFFPAKESSINKKEFIANLKKDLIDYVIKEHKILDNSVVRNVDTNICRLLEKVAEEHGFNYFDLVYDYAMAFSNEEEVRTTKVPIILYNLYYIKESNLNLLERAKLIKASKDAQKKANFDVMGYNIPLLRVEYFLKRIFGFNTLKEISGEKIS